MARSNQALIIKRIEDGDHDGHHGGAWKVAYADFMTAMMAFFLLLWILSSSDEQKLKGIAEYFTDATLPGGLGVLDGASIGPPGILNASNGVVLARGTEIDEQSQSLTVKWEVRDATDDGSLQVEQKRDASLIDEDGEPADDAPNAYNSARDVEAHGGPSELSARTAKEYKSDENTLAKATVERTLAHAEDDRRFAQFQDQFMQAMQSNPDLRPLMKNVMFEKSNDGLNVQIIDQKGQPMFASGSASMLQSTRQLMDELARNLAELPNQLKVTGHTDATPFSSNSEYDNWDLSTDRANEARRILVSSGIDPKRLSSVSGKAHTEPLVASEPNHPSNRRITLFLVYGQLSVKHGDTMKTNLAPLTTEKNAKGVSNLTMLNEQTLENLRSVLR